MDIEIKISSILSNSATKCELDDIPKILSRFNFKKNFQIITIAGTNGKGTTVAMLEELFVANNKKVVTHTSPHIFKFNERISLNKKPIATNDLLELLERLQEETRDYKLTYYQIAFLCACMYAQKHKADYLILEVGLGGRLDCANALSPDITAITNISLDHCEILGDTVEKIGLEKAAIARKDVPLILGSEMPKSVTEYAKKISAKVYQPNYETTESDCFIDSYNIAMKIAEMLFMKLKISYIPNFQSIRARARCFELKKDVVNNSYIIIDVAHNEASVSHLLKFVRDKYSGINIEAVFGVLASKDISTILDIANAEVSNWQVLNLKNYDDRAINLQDIKQEFERKAITKVEYREDLSNMYLSKNNSLTLVFGSFVMAGEFLKEYEKTNK